MDKDLLGLQTALAEAKKSYDEGGIPIGSALLLGGDAPTVLGSGHNQRIQRSSPTLHGEMDALENAGRLKAEVYKNCTMVRLIARNKTYTHH